MVFHCRNYINGKWIHSQKTFRRENPARINETISVAPVSSASDVDAAVKAAHSVFSKWKAVSAPKRAEIMYTAARLLEERKNELAHFMCKEMGKPIKECLGDVQEGIDIGYYMAGEGRRLFGQTMPSELPNKHIRTVRVSVGVFALITPWNFPVAIPCWKIFPALVCGNTVVFKPSSFVPGCATKLIEIFHDAGVPAGVLNLVHGSGGVGDAIVRHNGVTAVSFTGSVAVGKTIGEYCGKHLKKHSLEMGGKNVVIVMDDADIELAVDGCVWGAFGTTGQRCTAPSRIVVHAKVYDKFKRMFLSRTRKLRLGDGFKSDIGPLVNAEQVKKVERYIGLARKNNLHILCGGKRALSGVLKHGYFFGPTIIDNPPQTHSVCCEEIFGPIVVLLKVKSFDDAIAVANNVDYGLSAAIFTNNVHLAHRAAEQLEAGIVYINSATIGAEIQAPFGGVKNTGNGHREAGGMGGAIDTYTEMKVINVDFSGRLQKAQGIDGK